VGVAGSRVGIVGGSIAGCAMAAAAARLGCDVAVFEASSADLEDRGAGIVIPLALRRQLTDRGYLSADTPYVHPTERLWFTAAAAAPLGRVMWRHAFPAAMHNWGVLWRTMRELVPEPAYRRGEAIRACRPGTDQVTVVLGDDSLEAFDLLIGADGYCSTVRETVRPDIRPAYVGYVLWRGNYEERFIADPAVLDVLDKAFVTVHFPGGHAVIYLIPGRDGRTGRGERRVNWALYGTPPPLELDLQDPTSFPPGKVPGALIERLKQIVDAHLPPAWADLVRAGGPEEISVQPIYDHAVPSFVSGRTLLVGDAAALSRPHTASGATKAMQEALALETAGSVHDSWPALVAAFDAERCGEATELVETGRLLGRGLVEHTPDWAAMSTAQVEQFISALIAGRSLYMQPSAPGRDLP